MIACVKATTTTIGTTTSTSPATTTTTTLAPTTTTMNYCVEEKGMNQPLNIPSTQVISNPPPSPPTSYTDINPTPTSPGLNFPSNPQINVTLDQPTTITVIYVPHEIPTNVKEFTVQFVFPNGSSSPVFTSTIPSPTATTSTSTTTTTTTPAGGTPSPYFTTPSPVVPPSPISPQVNLSPPNSRLPDDTIVIITITLTTTEIVQLGYVNIFYQSFHNYRKYLMNIFWSIFDAIIRFDKNAAFNNNISNLK